MSISFRLKERRLARGLTQHQLAVLAGVRQQTIQRIESGSSHRPRNLLEISEALECSPHWLLNGTKKDS
ncbi:TPA: helix-turn-helix transcriptional regulator [Yersinia enterocolitica]|nr:helix-turn-helix transcriptional regulator [Yersinia enterocolitica]HDL8417362.1 helix-turn-helix transcriptional regulator [Yersinia enterocolitica]HDL8423762.1 helix-turn-helix transcriptional regulator [Yersinia enterocolitica]HDM8309800.1 helix-turn-helix transcriptional regulator [Yersinia enterocolitica]HDR0561556.1 helix-turn-helix transcriptional regulator [Yersinia enterocolitica]